MKWALAGSQLLLLSVLVFSGSWRAVGGFSVYLAFAIFSSVIYDPWNIASFAWLSIPSAALRLILLIECFWILTAMHANPRRWFLSFTALIGGLVIVSAGWGLKSDSGPVITVTVYLYLWTAGAIWTVLGVLWRKDALANDWRRTYALGLGVYFGSVALSAVSRPWKVSFYLTMTVYSAVFLWLSSHFLHQIRDPWPQEKYQEHYEPDGRELDQVSN